MKTRLHKKFIAKITVLFILLLPVTLVSCAKDDSQTKPPEKSGNTTIIFDLKVPAEDTMAKNETQTRGLLPADENEIRNAVVIAFKDGNYYYKATPKEAITDNVFKVDLIEGTYDIMVLTNYGSELPEMSPTQTKQEVLDVLIMTLEGDRKWIANAADAKYVATPMASLIKEEKIAGTAGFNKKTVKLYRMLAKVNVSVKDDAINNFILNSVYLYNVNKDGRMIPLFGSDDSYKANIPGQTKILGPVAYEFAETQSYLNEIYLFEVLNHDASDVLLAPDKRTCLVVGGKYDGRTDTRYYRIDFSNKVDTEMSYYNILRNHIYQVNIVKVTGSGFDKKEDAFNSGPIDMEVKIQDWNAGEITNIKTDGVYSLGVSEKSVKHTSAPQLVNTIKVKSDYPTNEIEVKASASATDPAITAGVEWITNAKLTVVDVSGGLTNYLLSYDISENSSTADRTGYIHITAGSIDMVITVTQEYMLYLRFTKKVGETWEEISALTFAQDSKDVAPASQRYRVEWAPKSNVPSLSLTPTGGEYKDITWYSGKSPLRTIVDENTSERQGQMEIEIQPIPIAGYQIGSFTEAQTTLNLSLVGKGITESLVIQQYVKEVHIIAPTNQLMDGKSTHYVTVKSNVDWELYANKNISSGVGAANAKVVKSIGSVSDLQVMNNVGNAKTIKVSGGGRNLPNGTEVSITTVSDVSPATIYMGHLGLYAEAMGTPAVNDAKSILCSSAIFQDGREANCYVLNPESGFGLLIPVRAANGKMTDNYKTTGGQDLYKGDGGAFLSSIISNTATYGAKLVWADVAGSTLKGLGNDALLSLVAPVGNGESGHILVMPGHVKKEGNAVVAVTRNKDGTGDILWSWHIWVTTGMKFEDGKNMESRIMPGQNGAGPLARYWLDRNLGALNNGGIGNTNIYTYGLHYQWGRKDPFPGANKENVAIVGQSNERQLYNATGAISMGTNLHGCVTYKLGGTDITVQVSIENPLTYYFNNASLLGIQHWLSMPIYNDLWGVAIEGDLPVANGAEPTNYGKSVFDPCPAGYRVPRRTAKKWDDSSNTHHWGGEIANMTVTMGNPAANIGTNRGFLWPTITYKGGWYPATGIRTSAGISANVGEEAACWGSSSNTMHANRLTVNTILLAFNDNKAFHHGLSVRCVAY